MAINCCRKDNNHLRLSRQSWHLDSIIADDIRDNWHCAFADKCKLKSIRGKVNQLKPARFDDIERMDDSPDESLTRLPSNEESLEVGNRYGVWISAIENYNEKVGGTRFVYVSTAHSRSYSIYWTASGYRWKLRDPLMGACMLMGRERIA